MRRAANAEPSGRAKSHAGARPASGSQKRARAGGEKQQARAPRDRDTKKRPEPAKPRAAKARPVTPVTPGPAEMLSRAMAARTPRARGIWARRGLACRRRIDATTQSMLLRQLYLAHFEERRFAKALEVSQQAIELEVLLDVAHQDAARAAQALGDVDAAAGHLRLAARSGPPKRRAFHWWTLGSLYYLARRYDEAISALARAARWGTTDKPLYQGHLALARCALGERVDELGEIFERLSNVPSGQGYGRFVLGHLAFHRGRVADARAHLEAFVARTTSGRAALAIALEGELAKARETLAQLPAP